MAISNIVLSDAAVPAVDHTFVPTSAVGGKVVYQELGSPVSQRQNIVFSSIKASNSGYRSTWTLTKPHVPEALDGCCIDPNTRIRNSWIRAESFVDATGVPGDIDNLIAEFRAFVLTTEFANTVKGIGIF